MSQSSRLLFVGGSTMRGHSVSGQIDSYAQQLARNPHHESTIIAKDRILISEVLDIVEKSRDFDVLVVQVGVADSLLRRLKVKGNSHLITYFPYHRQAVTKRFLKQLLYFARISRARTKYSAYCLCIEKISAIASMNGARIIWLGSIVAPIRLSKIETKIKSLYCKYSFRDIVERMPENQVFIDVDAVGSNFVDELDIFHLNQLGHNLLRGLIEEKLDNWRI
jgi:hypothetical protein